MRFEKEWYEHEGWGQFLAISSTGVYLWIDVPDPDYNETFFTAGVDREKIGEFVSLEEAKKAAEDYYDKQRDYLRNKR